ncbi:hypothetical protein YT1_5034 [Rhodococcus ruber]|nr:hypothetical protein YT1_5034 [Rhodococcus ruber]
MDAAVSRPPGGRGTGSPLPHPERRARPPSVRPVRRPA